MTIFFFMNIWYLLGFFLCQHKETHQNLLEISKILLRDNQNLVDHINMYEWKFWEPFY